MEPLTTLLLPAITETVFGSLAEAVGLSDWLKDRLKRDPEKLAFQQVLTQTLTDTTQQFPGRDLRYFAEVLRDVGGSLLARTLQPAASLPTAAELTQLWLNHLTIDSKIHYRQEFERFAQFFLERLIHHIENQQPLQWIVQARRERSNADQLRRLADAAEKNAVTLAALQDQLAQSKTQLDESVRVDRINIATDGSTMSGSNVMIGSRVYGDLTIKNYIIQGLPRLVIDYSSRIQEFLLEYLGSKRKRVPFGGRQQQLDELTTWLDDPTAPPYYLMSAEAGRGKSALVCRWLAQLTTRSDLDLIFVPISIRFETATQDVVFAALAARLANLYESEPEKLPPASLTAEQWKGVCQSYLRREPPVGKKLLVILDGLDETTGWTPARNLFSSDPPEGLRVLVTARTRPGESGANGWATTLGWEDRQLARTVTLAALDRRGVEEALLSMGNPLDKLASKVDVVGELQRLSEGDPLLVRLYVDALVAEKDRIATLQVTDLQHIKPGLAGYFERCWQDQHEQWLIQGRDPIVEQANLRTLLNAIAAAMGPLLLDDLAALHPDLSDSMLVRGLIQQVSRLLVGDGKVRGYSYSHPLLGYYFWEQLGEHEQEGWDDRFVSWGTRILAELNAEKLAPARTQRYLLHHYAAHLERGEAPAEKFYALISNGWRKAWEMEDVSFGGFLNDLALIKGHGRLTFGSSQMGIAEMLVHQVRVSLCQSSIAALNSTISPTLALQLIEVGIYTTEQVFAIMKCVPYEEQQVDMVARLGKFLVKDLTYETITFVRSMKTDKNRASALIRLSAYMPLLQKDLLLEDASQTIRVIKDSSIRAQLLYEYALHLPDTCRFDVFCEALDTISEISWEITCAEMLCRLVKFLPDALMTRAISVATSLRDDTYRVISLIGIAPHVRGHEQEAVGSAIRSIGQIRDRIESTDNRQTLLITNDLIRDAWIAATQIEEEYHRVWAMNQLIPHLPIEYLDAVLESASGIRDEFNRSLMINTLLPRTPDRLIHKLPDLLSSLESDFAFVDAISSITSCEYNKLKLSIDNRIETIKLCRLRSQALSIIASIVSEYDLRKSIIRKSFSSARIIEDEEFNLQEPLDYLLHYVPISKRNIVARDILNEALMDPDETARARSLVDIFPHLTEQLMTEAIVHIRQMQSELSRTLAQSQIIPYSPTQLLDDVLLDINAMSKPAIRVDSLIKFTKRLPKDRPVQIVTRLLDELYLLENRDSFLYDLFELSQNLTDEQQILVQKVGFRIIHNIAKIESKVNALRKIIPFLKSSDQVNAAFEVINTISSEQHVSELLICLAPQIPELQFENAVALLQTLRSPNYLTLTVIGLAPYTPKTGYNSIFNNLEGYIDAIESDYDRVIAIADITPILQVSEREPLIDKAVKHAQKIEDEESHAFALSRIATYLPQETKSVLFEEVIGIISSIEDEKQRSYALREVAPQLPLLHLFSAIEVVSDIEEVEYRARSLPTLLDLLIDHTYQSPLLLYRAYESAINLFEWRPRPDFLRDLAAFLPLVLTLAGDEAPQAAEGIYHAIQEVCEWWP